MEISTVRAWADACEPVFICGVERSGTSTLQLALAQHPALFQVPDVYETFVFSRPAALLEDPVPHMLQAYIGGARRVERLRRNYDLAALDSADRIRSFFYFAAHRVYPGKRPLEKTPSHVRKLALMCELFPKARIIVCTRDPVAVVASYRQRLQKEQALGLGRETWGWLDCSLDYLIDHCLSVGRHMRRAAATHGSQLFVAPYEWLTAQPQAALTALCAHAGLPYDSALLAPRPRSASAVDAALSQPIGAHPIEINRYLDASEQQEVKKGTASLHPLWDTPGPMTAFMGAPAASA